MTTNIDNTTHGEEDLATELLPLADQELPRQPSILEQERATVRAFVAARCACCGTKLDDPVSIEAGVGPDCRRMHGYNKPETSADWPAVCESLGASGAHGLYETVKDRLFVDARAVARAVVHRMACEETGATAIRLVNVVRALGYVKLAERVTQRLAQLEVAEADGEIIFRHPYSPAALQELKRVPTLQWEGRTKTHRCERAHKAQLLAAIRRGFPRMVVSTPEGLFPTEELPLIEARPAAAREVDRVVAAGPVVVSYVGADIAVRLPAYDPAIVLAMKAIEGRWYHRGTETNRFPRSQEQEVLRVLARFFAGQKAVGPRGEFVFPAAA